MGGGRTELRKADGINGIDGKRQVRQEGHERHEKAGEGSNGVAGTRAGGNYAITKFSKLTELGMGKDGITKGRRN